MEKKIGIAKNAHMIDMLKSSLIMQTGNIFLSSLKTDAKDELTENIANAVLSAYLLAKRLGVEYSRIDERICEKAKLGIASSHLLEESGDLSEIMERIKKRG